SRSGRKQWIESLLPLHVGHRPHMLSEYVSKLAQRPDELFSFTGIAIVEGCEHHNFFAVRALGKKRQRWRMAQHSPHVQLPGCGFYKLTVSGQHLFCVL